MHTYVNFLNHAIGKIFLYKIGTLCDMTSAPCDERAALCNMGAL